MSSSKSRSASAEIVPPSISRSRDLVFAMNGASDSKHRDSDRDEDADGDVEAEVEAEQALPAASKASSSANAGNAPTPCERCVRTGRVCKGVAGARCEYCKRLKQKCSNSSGPARGKNAAMAKKAAAEAAASTKDSSSKAIVVSAPPMLNGIKRKQLEQPLGKLNGDVDGFSADGDGDDDHQLPPRLNKKRRISRGNKGISRSELVKTVEDLEGSVTLLRATVAKEVDRMQGVITTLKTMITDMESD